MIPCAWALINGNCDEAYTAILEKIKTFIPELQMTSALTNFSQPLHTSIHQLYPEATISGSLHHYQEVFMIINNELQY